MAALIPMNQDRDPNGLMTERVERRLSDECGKLRVEMVELRGGLKTDVAELRGEMRAGTAELRGEMVRGNTALLKWLLVFFVTQTAALAAILRLFVN